MTTRKIKGKTDTVIVSALVLELVDRPTLLRRCLGRGGGPVANQTPSNRPYKLSRRAGLRNGRLAPSSREEE